MKKAIRAISILLILTMLLSTAALAIDDPSMGLDGSITIKNLKSEDGYTIKVLEMLEEGPWEQNESESYSIVEPGFKLSYTCDDASMQVIYLFKGDTPVEDTLYYIDQQSKTGTDPIEFIIFPKAMDAGDYTIKRSDDNGVTSKTAATFTVETGETPGYTLGDINNDTEIDIKDAGLALNHIVENSILTGNALLAANVSGDKDEHGNPIVDIKDVGLILNKIVGNIDHF